MKVQVVDLARYRFSLPSVNSWTSQLELRKRNLSAKEQAGSGNIPQAVARNSCATKMTRAPSPAASPFLLVKRRQRRRVQARAKFGERRSHGFGVWCRHDPRPVIEDSSTAHHRRILQRSERTTS
ncbi:hypothetical protein MRX96_007209 [Rhipicephalus microplus]